MNGLAVWTTAEFKTLESEKFSLAFYRGGADSARFRASLHFFGRRPTLLVRIWSTFNTRHMWKGFFDFLMVHCRYIGKVLAAFGRRFARIARSPYFEGRYLNEAIVPFAAGRNNSCLVLEPRELATITVPGILLGISKGSGQRGDARGCYWFVFSSLWCW